MKPLLLVVEKFERSTLLKQREFWLLSIARTYFNTDEVPLLEQTSVYVDKSREHFKNNDDNKKPNFFL